MHRKILRIPYTKRVTNEEVRKVWFDRERRAFENGKEKKAEVFWTYGAAQQLAEDCDEGQSSWKTGERTSEKKREDDVKGMLNTSMQGAGTLAQHRRTFRKTVITATSEPG